MEKLKAMLSTCCNKTAATSAHSVSGDCPPESLSGDAALWSLDFTHMLGQEGSEEINRALGIQMLEKGRYSSVTKTVDSLNANSKLAPSGMCAIFSNSQQMWFLLWRQDKTADATRTLEQVNELLAGMESAIMSDLQAVNGRGASASSQNWTTDMLIELGAPGAEEAFVGSVPVLDRYQWPSISSTVDALNRNDSMLQETLDMGLCVAFSERQQIYYLLYRRDKEQEVLAMMGGGDGAEAGQDAQYTGYEDQYAQQQGYGQDPYAQQGYGYGGQPGYGQY